MKKILVIEDHVLTRKWWADQLPKIFDDTQVYEAERLEDARTIASRNRFWLAIIDINLPDGNGISFIDYMHKMQPGCWTVICTVYDDDEHVFAALRAGAQGYMVKDEAKEIQIARLRDIINGQPPLTPGVSQRILKYFENTSRINDVEQLTPRESEILLLLSKGYSKPEISRMLNLSINTVSTHSKKIYSKLHINSRAEAVSKAIQIGILEIK